MRNGAATSNFTPEKVDNSSKCVRNRPIGRNASAMFQRRIANLRQKISLSLKKMKKTARALEQPIRFDDCNQ